MNLKDLKHLKAWFADYVAGFYTDDSDNNRTVHLKEKHTKRVCENIIMLGNALGLSDQEMILAETMGLFHDIGRFKQYAVYGTFNDMESENHAELGLREMATHNVLAVCSRDDKRWIEKAIAYHNAATIPEDEDEKTLFYIRLLRDADKLDIWKVLTDYYKKRDKQPNSVLEIGLPDDPACSPQIIAAIRRGRLALIQDLKTLNDFRLLQISWVFDLNFAPSFQAVKTCEYIEQIEATLPHLKEIVEAVKQAYNHVNSHL
ncbi:MAG: HD domain-containing protein [Deltaproteobacteria bacterium]|nr:HD domain-containing protein [Deltaproteobacteria bacterium]